MPSQRHPVRNFMPSQDYSEADEIEHAEALSFTRRVPKDSPAQNAYPETGIHNIPDRPPTRGGTVYDQYHKQQVTIRDVTKEDQSFKKTPEEMAKMKIQLKYGSPLVTECFAWGHDFDWSTTSRPEGVKKTKNFNGKV